MRYFKKIVGELVYLSPVNLEDLEKYTTWVNDIFIASRLGSASKNFSREKEKEFLEDLVKDGHNFAIVKKDSDKLMGNVSLFDINQIHRTALMGVFIGDEENRGKGMGKESIKLILEYGFKILNLNNVMLNVFSFNEKAIEAYKSVGFKEIGKRREAHFINGQYFDEIYMDILEKDFKSNYLNSLLPKRKWFKVIYLN